MATFSSIIKRVYYLRGDSDYTTASTDLTIIKSHINAAIQDIINVSPFSWNLKTADLTLAAGSANLPADYNPKWHIEDARISNSSTNDDSVFSEIPVADRDAYTTDDYGYYIVYSTTSSVHQFKSPTQTGTVTIYYHFIPDDLSGDSDVCIVPDAEAVAYLAAAKMWVGDERNQPLKADYEQEAATRIKEMYVQDVNFGPNYSIKSVASSNPKLTQRGS